MRSAVTTPSPLANSEEKTDGAKLHRLLIDGGTAALRNLFDRYYPPASLAEDLFAQKPLMHRQGMVSYHWEMLFPSDGSRPHSKNFDITLLCLLLTNICGLRPPLSGWYEQPPSSDTSLEANIARLRFYRNKMAHMPRLDNDTPTFNALWQELSTILVDLGLDRGEIDRLKEEPFWEGEYHGVLQDWLMKDQDNKKEIEKLNSMLSEVRDKINEVHWTVKQPTKALEELHKVVESTHESTHERLERVEDKIDRVLHKIGIESPRGDSTVAG